jgi:hypothetical protein
MFKLFITKKSLAKFAALFVLTAGLAQGAFADVLKSPAAPEGASVYIVSPADGAEVTGPVTVVFGLKGMGVAPAGVEKDKTGHHHLLVDQTELPKLDAPMGNPPLHFGGGQTETTLELEPGTHTLQLILGNYLHVPFSPMILSEKIIITVK